MPRSHLPSSQVLQLHRSLLHLAKAVWRFSPKGLLASFALSGSLALTEGIGLLMLIPLLALLGVGGDAGAASGLAHEEAMLWLAIPDDWFTPTVLLSVFVALVGLRVLLKFGADQLNAWLRLAFVDVVRNQLFRRISLAPWMRISPIRHADLMNGLSTEMGRVGQCMLQLQQLPVQLAMLLVYLAGAFWLAPILTALGLAVGLVLMGGVYLGARKQSFLQGEQMVGHNRRLLHTVEQFLGGLKWAKAHGTEPVHMALFEDLTGQARDNQIRFQRMFSGRQGAFQFVSALSLAGFVWLAVDRHMPVDQLLLLIVIAARLLPLLGRLAEGMQRLLHTLPAYEAVLALEAQCGEERDVPIDRQEPVRLEKGVVLQGVRFKYPGTESSVFIENLSIVASQTLALVGPSGAGKTTFADLVAGLLSPSEGQVLIDGEPLDRRHSRAWQRSIAYVPQDSFLLDDTLRANLQMGAREVSDEAMWHALEQAAADDFVRDLPAGLDTILGPRGVRMSGGERQRIALARALLSQPSLLILDEATSALDVESEGRIQAAIDNLHGELTLLVIAHRLSTVRHADRIAVMEAGQVVQMGSWEALVQEHDGVFARMVAADFCS